MASAGDIVKISFPHTDFRESKDRYAVVLYFNPSTEDIIIAAITSQKWEDPGDFPLSKKDAEFAMSGLKTDSWFRIGKLVTAHQSLILQYVGKAGPKTQARINEKLKLLFKI